jgi:hypothetical protein
VEEDREGEGGRRIERVREWRRIEKVREWRRIERVREWRRIERVREWRRIERVREGGGEGGDRKLENDEAEERGTVVERRRECKLKRKREKEMIKIKEDAKLSAATKMVEVPYVRKSHLNRIQGR